MFFCFLPPFFFEQSESGRGPPRLKRVIEASPSRELEAELTELNFAQAIPAAHSEDELKRDRELTLQRQKKERESKELEVEKKREKARAKKKEIEDEIAAAEEEHARMMANGHIPAAENKEDV